jgi:hypothetical protein
MSGFTLEITETLTFDSDELTVVMEPLKENDLIALQPLITDASKLAELSSEVDADGDGNTVTLSPAVLSELSASALPVVVNRVKQVTGLTDSNGNELDFKVAFSYSYFHPLVLDIAYKLLNHAFLTEDNIKKSKAISADKLQESA